MQIDTLASWPTIRTAFGGDTAWGEIHLNPANGPGDGHGHGPLAPVWCGPYAIDDLAVACVAAATASAAAFAAARNGTDPDRVTIDPRHAAAFFRAESYVDAIGWTMPPIWDPLAGDYRTRPDPADATGDTGGGWVRLHTNYPHHRARALAALGIDDTPHVTRDDVAAAVATRTADDVETAVVAAGGVAAACRSRTAWQAHPASVVADEALVVTTRHASHGAVGHRDCGAAAAPAAPAAPAAADGLPLAGVRVVDLTRVLAGPTATGFCAAWGADVIRIDPPDFAEVAALVPVTTAGKRCIGLDLRRPDGAATLARLVRDADVVVHGYRPDALAALGIDTAAWHAANPRLVECTLDAYGWHGPWRQRRGFDSIVQHSVGITDAGRAAHTADRPVPLPCQALDHAAGWLLAAAAATGLRQRHTDGHGSTWRTSLARVAALLMSLPCDVAIDRPAPTLADLADLCVDAPTESGPLRRLRWPGTIGHAAPTVGPATAVGRTTTSDITW